MYDVILDMEDAMEDRELFEPAPGDPVNPVGVTEPPLNPENRRCEIIRIKNRFSNC